MAKSTASLADGEIREGYFCPICLSDLKNVSQLQEHFELVHPSEDHDVIQTLKGFFDKAKRKILKREIVESDSVKSGCDSEQNSIKYDIQEYSWPLQEIGKTHCHKKEFLDFRKNKVDYYDKESNKLLIRLAKLLNDVSCDVEKRKELENNVIPWVKNSDVPLCPSCGKTFGLSRRWHHCRLCGYVMCKSCSCFISYEFVQKLVDTYMSESLSVAPRPSPASRRASSISFTGIINAPVDPQLRICGECNLMLKRRDRRKELENYSHLVVQLYQRMREHMLEVEKLVPQYIDMIESLNSGETEYQLQEAQELKGKITKLAERTDAYSKKISKLETEEDGEEGHRSIQLRAAIRVSTTQFLRNTVNSLPPLLTQTELDTLQSQRLDKVFRRIQKEKEKELQQFQNQKENSKSPSPEKLPPSPIRLPVSPVTPDTGWCVSTDGVSEDGDLMIQQMNLIERYIQQAMQDQRHDEVQMLKANLQELKQEYSRQQALKN